MDQASKSTTKTGPDGVIGAIDEATATATAKQQKTTGGDPAPDSLEAALRQRVPSHATWTQMTSDQHPQIRALREMFSGHILIVDEDGRPAEDPYGWGVKWSTPDGMWGLAFGEINPGVHKLAVTSPHGKWFIENETIPEIIHVLEVLKVFPRITPTAGE